MGKITRFTTIPQDYVPNIPAAWRICPTCLDPMGVWYAWKSSERVIHYFLLCNCGNKTKGALHHYRINSKGELVR